LGTTRKGIGPTYSSKASRSGLRVCDLAHPAEFETKLRKLVANKKKRYGDFEYDVDAEVALYKVLGYFFLLIGTFVWITQKKDLSKRLEPYIIDSIPYVNHAIQSGKRVLVEGANALMLDLDFGTYPYVTSSNTGIGGVCTGLGIPPRQIKNVVGVVKAYTTRVGAGPFPTEQLNVSKIVLNPLGNW
jgi:adenylosuccinate synthase